MIAGLRRRIGQLEERIGGSAVTLYFADGTSRTIRGDSSRWAALHSAWCEMETVELDYFPAPENGLFGELAAIGRAIRIDEEGGRYGLLSIMLKGPNLDGEASQ